MNKQIITILIAVTTGLLLSATADAYIGPGAGLTVIGTVIALVGAVLLAIVGFVWYPIKRLRAKFAKTPDEKDAKESDKRRDDQEQDA